MSTTAAELEAAAATAWERLSLKSSILRTVAGIEPMPVPVALDFVQNVTGERDDAVEALLLAAGKYLESIMPGADVGNILTEAFAVVGDIKSEFFSHAESAINTVSFRAQDIGVSTLAGVYGDGPGRPNVFVCEEWHQWAQEAERVLGFAREIVREAYPEPTESA